MWAVLSFFCVGIFVLWLTPLDQFAYSLMKTWLVIMIHSTWPKRNKRLPTYQLVPTPKLTTLETKALKQTSHPYPPSLNDFDDCSVSIFSRSFPGWIWASNTMKWVTSSLWLMKGRERGPTWLMLWQSPLCYGISGIGEVHFVESVEICIIVGNWIDYSTTLWVVHALFVVFFVITY